MPERSVQPPSAAVDTHNRPDPAEFGPREKEQAASALTALDTALGALRVAPTLPTDLTDVLAHAIAAAAELERLLRVRPPVVNGAQVPASLAETDRMLVCGPLRIDVAARRVSLADRPVRVTPTEFRILYLLALTPGRIVTREQLLEQVWGKAYLEANDYLWVHLSRLRRKLSIPGQPSLIITERGLGYRLRIAKR